jgi:hypothetical protein
LICSYIPSQLQNSSAGAVSPIAKPKQKKQIKKRVTSSDGAGIDGTSGAKA